MATAQYSNHPTPVLISGSGGSLIAGNNRPFTLAGGFGPLTSINYIGSFPGQVTLGSDTTIPPSNSIFFTVKGSNSDTGLFSNVDYTVTDGSNTSSTYDMDILIVRGESINLALESAIFMRNILNASDNYDKPVTALTFTGLPPGVTYVDSGVGTNRVMTFQKSLITSWGQQSFIFSYTVGGVTEQGSTRFTFYEPPASSVPPSDTLFGYDTVGGGATSNNLGINYRGNTTVTANITPVGGSGLSFSQTGQTVGDPGSINIDITGTTAGFYEGNAYTLIGNQASGNGNMDVIVMNTAPVINLDATPYSYSYQIMTVANSAGLDGSGNGISFNFPSGNYSYDHATRTITVLKAGLLEETVNIPYTVSYAGGTKTGSGNLSLTLQGGPGINAGFVGGKYSSTGTATSSSGSSYSTTSTGTATSSSWRTELQNTLMNHYGDMIRARVDSSYTNVGITGSNSNQFLYEEGGSGYSSDYTNTLNMILKVGTPEEITDTTQIAKITTIVKNHFRQMRNHLLKFYNYTPSVTSGCESSSVDGSESCVTTCNTGLNLTFQPL